MNTKVLPTFFDVPKSSFGEHNIHPTKTGTSKTISMGRFGSTFYTTECHIWAKSDEKCVENDPSKSFSTLQNLRLGAIHRATCNYEMCDVEFEKRLVFTFLFITKLYIS